MNLRELFSIYHFGFDNFGRWCDHHRAMHTKHPLGCEEFGAGWLRRWGEIGRLLQSPARMETFIDGKWHVSTAHGLAYEWFDRPRFAHSRLWSHRLVLLDGTIIREWPAKDEYDDIF
jgi:hypothetical protein